MTPSFTLNTNNFWLAREACIEGRGISLLPVLLCGEDIRKGNLVPVLPNYYDSQKSIYAIFPSRKLLAPQVRAFLDLLDKNKDKSLTSNRSPSIKDPIIQNYMNKMKLSTPKLIFDFDFKID